MKVLKKQTLDQGVETTVPPNYALSFDIIPLGTTIGYGSIIHYTQDHSDIGRRARIPGMLSGML